MTLDPFEKISNACARIGHIAAEHRSFGGHKAVVEALHDIEDAAKAIATNAAFQRDASRPAVPPSDALVRGLERSGAELTFDAPSDAAPLTREELDALPPTSRLAPDENGLTVVQLMVAYDRLYATARAGLADTERLNAADEHEFDIEWQADETGAITGVLIVSEPAPSNPDGGDGPIVFRNVREAIDYTLAAKGSTKSSGLPDNHLNK